MTQTIEKLSVLKGLTALTEKISIYVPSTFNVDIAINSDEYSEKIEKELSTLFGGCTRTRSKGSYVCSNGFLVQEDVNIIYAFTDALNNHKLDAVLNMCIWLKEEMEQECISLEINNKLYFI